MDKNFLETRYVFKALNNVTSGIDIELENVNI